MMTWVLEHKWLFFIAGEIVFWTSLIAFFVLRYLLGWKRAGWAVMLFSLASDLWLAFLGYLDYRNTGRMETFQIVIVIVLVYALIYGRRDFAKLDRWIRRLVARMKGTAWEETGEGSAPLYGREHAVKEVREFGLHALLYLGVHLVFWFAVGLSDAPLPAEEQTGYALIDRWSSGWFKSESVSNFSRIWTVVLGADALISLSYVVWPKQPKPSKRSETPLR